MTDASRVRKAFGCHNAIHVIMTEETQAFIDAMLAKKTVFITKSSKSRRRVEKHYERFRSRK